MQFFGSEKSVLVRKARKARKKRATLNPSCPKRMRRVLVAARKVGRRRVKAARRGHRQKHRQSRQKHRQSDFVSYRKPRTVARAQHVRDCVSATAVGAPIAAFWFAHVLSDHIFRFLRKAVPVSLFAALLLAAALRFGVAAALSLFSTTLGFCLFASGYHCRTATVPHVFKLDDALESWVCRSRESDSGDG